MTTKIQFKLSNDVLLTVIQMVEKTDDYIVQSIKDALLISIKEDLLTKLEDKAKNIQKQISILDHNKKHAIVLKYHEAYTMYKLLELVYEKETFADHAHIKKIKRLLLDLENKVESFTTENTVHDAAETTSQALVHFPRLGVNEIIIEEATILEGDLLDELESIQCEDDDNLLVDSSVDINEIIVKNYSIFDVLEETEPKMEENIHAIEVEEEIVDITEILQLENSADWFGDLPSSEETVVPSIESLEETVECTPIEEEATIDEEESNLESAVAEQEDPSLPSWAQQVATPVFDGIVTKTSICIEPEDTFARTTSESEEETLPLFDGENLETQPSEEKVEKEGKKEKKKPTKDNTQQGQISLF